jgi:hypothetical protein
MINGPKSSPEQIAAAQAARETKISRRIAPMEKSFAAYFSKAPIRMFPLIPPAAAIAWEYCAIKVICGA